MKPIDINIDIDLDGFDITKSKLKTKCTQPKVTALIPESRLKYSRAEDLVDKMTFERGFRNYAIITGNFCFGDIIEAIIVKNNWKCEEMVISTLSLNENNIDSLENLFNGDYLDKLSLIVSAYFYSHEKYPGRLIEYILNSLDKDNRLDLAVTRTHCKLCQFTTDQGHKIVMHGSANLRSNNSLEQLMIEDNSNLYDFNKEFQFDILKKHSIMKSKAV